jgi:hypothetical protein
MPCMMTNGTTAPEFHGKSRPMRVEREATHRAISFSELMDVPILIVHVSGAEAVEQIRWGRSRGLSIFAETCPQYLFLTHADMALDGFHGARCICSPPPRACIFLCAQWRTRHGNSTCPFIFRRRDDWSYFDSRFCRTYFNKCSEAVRLVS